jgi:hypothetical protein
MFRDGYAGLVGSADAGLVDDGGENSTSDSLFGRIRYAYLHLPRWLRDYAPVFFTKMRIICEARQGYLVGDSRKGNIGRGGTYSDGLIDEAAYIEFGEASLAAAEPACEVLDLQSTPNGRKNMLARLFHAKDSKYLRETYGWWEIPHRRIGLYRDPEDGRLRSPWYDERTRDLSDERRAREYDLDFTTSTSGLVYKELSMSRPPAGHVVPAAEMGYDPRLPLGIGLDFGHARKTAGVLVQPHGVQLRVIADFEGKHRDAGSNARDLARLVREVGFTQGLQGVALHPDPSGQWEDQGSGQSVLSYYQAVGFNNWHFPMLQGPQSVRLGIALVREKLVAREILISDRCEALLDRIQDYRYPTDPRTDDIRSDTPVHNMASHIMDALRYAVTALFTAAGPNVEDDFSHPGDVTPQELGIGEPRSTLDDYDDDLPPRGPGRHVPGGRLREYGGY